MLGPVPAPCLPAHLLASSGLEEVEGRLGKPGAPTGWCRWAGVPTHCRQALAPSPEQAGALREVRGRVGISCDTLSPKPRKPRDRAGPAGMPAGSESCSLTPPGPGRLAEARGVQLGSTLCLQVSTQPSAGKMTSLPPPVGKVRPHTPSAHGIGQETGPLGGCSPGLPPALWQAPGPAPQPCGP